MIRITPALIAAALLAGPHSVRRPPASTLRSSPTVLVTITGATQGQIPQGKCAGTLYNVSNFPSASALEAFALDETTTSSAPAGSGTFELRVYNYCVAPFFRAFAAHEALSVKLAYVTPTGSSLSPTMILSLTDARVTHVDVEWNYGEATLVTVGLASLQVSASAPGATQSGSAGTGASTAAPSGAIKPTVQPLNPAVAAGSNLRARAPSFRATGAQLTALKIPTPTSSNVNWAIPDASGGKVDLVTHLVATGAQSVDASFKVYTLSMSARYAIDAKGMPTGGAQITLQPISKSHDANTVALKNAAIAHAPLGQATLAFTNPHGVAGITISFKNAHLAGDVVSSGGESPTESITLAGSQLVVTDIGSTVTANVP